MAVRTRRPRLVVVGTLEDRVTPATMTWSGGNGLWSDTTRWSEPRLPDGNDDVVIASGATVTYDGGISTVGSVTLGGASTLRLTGGSFATTTTIDAPAATSDLVLAGGFLVNGTVTAGSEVIGTNQGGVLSGVTLAGTFNLAGATNVHAAVIGGLTLSGGTILLGSPAGNYGYLGFGGTQTLGGTGTVVFGTSPTNILHAGPGAGSHLTIGPGVTVRGHSGAVGVAASWGGPDTARVTNQGTIRADQAGGTIAVDGFNWTNAGTAAAAGGRLSLFGSNWTNTGTLTSAGGSAAVAPSPTGATQAGATVTITTAAAHGFTVGQAVTIAGVGAGYNGTFAVTAVPTATTFTYTAGTTGLAPAGGGTATLASTLNLDGTFATPTLGTVTSTGGTINLTGSLNNANSTLTLDATTGSWNMVGTIRRGTIATTGPARLVATPGLATLFGGVTLAGTLDLTRELNSRVFVLGGGLTLDNGTVLLGSNTGLYARLSFDDGGSQTLGGTGTVVFGTSPFNALLAGPTAGSHLTIGPGVTVRGHTGGIGYHGGWTGSTDVTFTNQGTIRADHAGGTITLNGADWLNTGTVEATNGGSLNLWAVVIPAPPGWTSTTPVSIAGGGTLDLRGSHWNTAGVTVNGSTLNLGGTFSRPDLGTLTRTGGTVSVTGILDNANRTLALDATTGSWRVDQGTIRGGTVTTADGTALIATPVRTGLDGVTLAGTLDAATENSNVGVVNGLTLAGGTVLLGRADGSDYSVLMFGDAESTLAGTGTVVFGRNQYNWVSPGFLPNSHLTIGPNVTIRGHTGGVGYHAGWGGEPALSVTLQGTVQADGLGGTITVDNATNYANGTLTGGTWKAVNAFLRLADGPVTTNAAHLVLDGPNATVLGHPTAFVDGLTGLSAVAAGGSLTVNGRVFPLSGPVANAGAVTVGPGGTLAVRHPYASSVVGFSSQWGSGTGTYSAAQALGAPNVFALGDNGNAWIPQGPDAGAEFLTVGFATPDFADGVIVRETNLPGFVTRIDAIDEGDVAHTVWTGTDASPPNQVSDFLVTWPRTAYRVKAVKVHINSALRPGWEAIDAVQLIGASTGYAQAGGTTTVAAGGTFTLTPGAAYAQAGGTTTVNGTLAASVPVDVQGGLLTGTGTISGSLTNGGTVSPGPGVGTLTVTGDYTQTAAGTLAVELGGPALHDRLAVGGSAALAGTLAADVVNGYVPLVGAAFTPLDLTAAGSAGGTTFAGLPEGATFDEAGPTTFRIGYAGGTGNDVSLVAVNRAPTLDPIADPPSTLENPGLQTVDLTGIGSGNVEPQTLTVTAVSDNPGLIPDPTVSYTSPNATGSLSYTPVVNRNGTATITVTVTDGGGTADGGVNTITRTFVVTVVELNDAPTLDAIPDPDDIPEDSGEQTVTLAGITAGGGESQTLTVTATSDNPALIPDPLVTYTSPDAVGSLRFTPAANKFGTATITVTVTDDGGTAFGGVDTITRTFTVTVDSVPDAPTINPDPLTTLDPVPLRTKVDVVPAGTLVSDLLASPFDGDGEPVGIAITGLDPANTRNARGVPKQGVWEFTLNGTLWSPIPEDVSPTTALVLPPTARVRLVPTLRFQGLSHLTFIAWDGSDGATAGFTTDSTVLTSAFGSDSERAWVAVGKTKPLVAADGSTLLPAVREDAKASRVFTVKTLLGLAGLESLPATNLGLAVTGQTAATGRWEYRLTRTKDFRPADTLFRPIDPVNAGRALLLRPVDQLRFIPALNANGSGGLTFKTWVPAATGFGTYRDTAIAGFGVNSGAATVPITPVNDAPVVNPALRPDLGTLAAGATTAPMTVSALLALQPGLATDVDPGAVLGIQLLPASAKVGKWQYFHAATNRWQVVLAAKTLKADAEIRFVASATAAAGEVRLGFKAWDGKLLSKLKAEARLTIG